MNNCLVSLNECGLNAVMQYERYSIVRGRVIIQQQVTSWAGHEAQPLHETAVERYALRNEAGSSAMQAYSLSIQRHNCATCEKFSLRGHVSENVSETSLSQAGLLRRFISPESYAIVSGTFSPIRYVGGSVPASHAPANR